jgi:molybdopterin synthase sulfur carrier subunit
MAVRVRMFAALREAAGTAEELVEPGALADLLESLCIRHGEDFRKRLAVSSVLVDGSTTPHDATCTVPDGAEVALLPPVSGGAGG